MRTFYFFKWFFVSVLLFAATVINAADIYLSSSGNDANDGSTALLAVKSFSRAQALAASGDVIIVSGMIDFSIDPANTSSPQVGIVLDKNLIIQGTLNLTDGFDGKGLTRFIQSGGFNLTLKNLKLTGGATTAGNGGALFLSGSTVTIENVIFDSNIALNGGAIYAASGTITIDGCSIQNNDNSGITLSSGGAIYVKPEAALSIDAKNSLFKNNKTAGGGAAIYYADIAAFASTMKFTSCAIVSNASTSVNTSGAVHINNPTTGATINLSFINTTMCKNIAGGANSGALYVGTALAGSYINLINCSITENHVTGTTGTGGAGVRFLKTTVNSVRRIYNTIIENNTALSDPLTGLSNYTDFAVQDVSTGVTAYTTGVTLIIEKSIIGRTALGTTALANTNFGAGNLINHVTWVTGTNYSASFKAKFGEFNTTHNYYPLLTGSFAIDYGLSTYLSTLTPSVTTDQVGTIRPFTGGLCYAGAVEISQTTLPYAPTSLNATAGDAQISVAFTEGVAGGSPISNYKYSTDGGTTYTECSPVQTSSPIVITGLTNGNVYSVKLKAVNANGDGAESTASNNVTPSTTPDAPTSLVATAGDAQISVAFAAGGSGGSAVTNYKYSIDGGTTYVACSPAQTDSPIVITGLTNGTVYTVKLKAVNANGDGAESAASNSVTPTVIFSSTTPDAPTALVATAGDAQISVAFTAGGDGGSAITGYKYSVNGAVYTTAVQTASPIIITGLTNGTAYTVKLKAVNANGDGAESAESNSVTPSTTPEAPTSLVATAGNVQISVAYTAGATGGSAITNYKYSVDGGTTFVACSPAQTTSPIIITGLTNGTAYTVKLKAVNANGDGAESTASNSVTPSTTPDAPTSLVATAGNAQVSVAFTAGATGGSAITNYKYSIDGGTNYVACSPAQTTSPIIITGLTNGNAYNVKLKAVNANGDGAESAASNSVTPSTTPEAPTALVATAGNAQVSVAFTAGATGGSAITNYKYSIDGGTNYVACSPAQTTSPIIITGLTNGTAYTVKLKAVNANGDGAESAASNSVTPTSPTGFDDNSDLDQNILIYSNANKQLTVKINYSTYKSGKMTIYNAFGQIIGSIPLNGSITTINYPFVLGVYIVSINIDGKIVTRKVFLN
ncbi:MAG: beta strand repeat-containing protein [Tenuifilaceae bacterium]